MRLEKRVSLVLVPVVGLIITALACVIWAIIYEQTRQNEIERTSLALRVNLVEVEQSVSVLNSQTTKIQELNALFSRILQQDEEFREYALSAGFLDFAYDLSKQIPHFTELLLLDESLNPVFRLNPRAEHKFDSASGETAPALADAIKNLHGFMKETIASRAVTVTEVNGEYEILATKIYSPSGGENASLCWTGPHYIFVLTAKAESLNTGLKEGAFQVVATRVDELDDLTSGIHLSAALTGPSGNTVAASSSLVDLEKTVSLGDVLSQLANLRRAWF